MTAEQTVSPPLSLREAVARLSEWDEEATIFAAQPWTPDAPAVLVTPGPDTTAPLLIGGVSYAYLLEVSVAEEVLVPLIDGGESLETMCARVISYAENDA